MGVCGLLPCGSQAPSPVSSGELPYSSLSPGFLSFSFSSLRKWQF